MDLLWLQFSLVNPRSSFSKLCIESANICKINPDVRRIKNCFLWSPAFLPVPISCRTAFNVKVLLLATIHGSHCYRKIASLGPVSFVWPAWLCSWCAAKLSESYFINCLKQEGVASFADYPVACLFSNSKYCKRT